MYVSQVPLYPASLFQNENDGEGFNIVMYFKLSQSYSKELPSFFLENIRVRFISFALTFNKIMLLHSVI